MKEGRPPASMILLTTFVPSYALLTLFCCPLYQSSYQLQFCTTFSPSSVVLLIFLDQVTDIFDSVSTTAIKVAPTLQALKSKTISLTQTAPPIVVESVTMTPTSDLDGELRGLLQTVTEVPLDMLKNDATFEELGIDSLMVTELLTELRKVFDIDIPPSDFQNLSDIKSLLQYLRLRGCGTSGATTPGSSTDSDISTDTSASSVAVLATSENDVSQLAKIVAENLDVATELTRETNLAEQGLDSLCSIELANDIKSAFGVEVNMTLLSGDSTFGDLIDLVVPQRTSTTLLVPKEAAVTVSVTTKDAPATSNGPVPLIGAQQAFEKVRYDYDVYTKQTGFFDFWKKTYPAQARLVSAYIVEAFTALGCPIATLKPNEPLPAVQYLPKHSKVMAQYYGILLSESLISPDGAGYVRSQKPVDRSPSSELYANILRTYPQPCLRTQASAQHRLEIGRVSHRHCRSDPDPVREQGKPGSSDRRVHERAHVRCHHKAIGRLPWTSIRQPTERRDIPHSRARRWHRRHNSIYHRVSDSPRRTFHAYVYRYLCIPGGCGEEEVRGA